MISSKEKQIIHNITLSLFSFETFFNTSKNETR